MAEAAAKSVIDGCGGLASLRTVDVAETAESDVVQAILCAAMVAYVETLPKCKQQIYAHLTRKERFGIEGGCRQVSPVFGYLLNLIHGGPVTKVVQRDDHAMLATLPLDDAGTLFIDATWRQGEDRSAQKRETLTDPRERLPMVRVSTEKPNLALLDQAVTEALRRRLRP